jgi:hypothetical protein
VTEDRAVAMPGPDDVMVPGIILAVVEHRRRIARLLDRLDGERRAVVEMGVAALEEGKVDVATLLARFGERLRADDGSIEAFVVDAEQGGRDSPTDGIATRSRGGSWHRKGDDARDRGGLRSKGATDEDRQ